MRASRIAALLLAFLFLAAWLPAQTPQRHPASPQEAAALKSLTNDFNDPQTSSTQMEEAISDFRQQFPDSAYTLAVLVLGVRFARAHGDYLHLLDYGQQVLNRDPHNLYTMASLGIAIPDNVKQTDLDRDSMLDQAVSYDRQVIAIASAVVVTGTVIEFQGNRFTPQQALTLKDNLEGPAYISLGRIAMMRQKYDDAVAAFNAALAFERTPQNQAQVYFDIGQAQSGAGRVPEAEAAFTKTLQLAPNSSFLSRMVQIERAKLKPGNP